ncbi:MAG: hypothetical protein L6N96_04820 [Candidatus Methylarchaceae archaeon HK02M2]|nr:hypothetical protein [Candidatus Methylarchaceae archaeon HK02M2]
MMSESPESKTLKMIIPQLKEKMIKSRLEYLGAEYKILNFLHNSKDILLKKFWINMIRYIHNFIDDLDIYLQTLEKLVSEHDATLTQIFYEATKEYQEQMKQKEDIVRKAFDYFQ